MQRKSIKIFTALLLVVCMIGVLVMSTACNKESGSDPTSVSTSVNGGDSAKTDTSNEGGTGTSTNIPSGNTSAGNNDNSGESGTDPVIPDLPAAVDRSDYSTVALAAKVMDTSVYDLAEAVATGDMSMLEGYMVGDIVHDIIMLVGASSILPNADFSAFCYVCYEDGTWSSVLAPKANNKIISAILGYKLDGSEELALTEEDLETYGDETLISILGYGNNLVVTSLADQSPVVGAIFNAKLKDIVGMFDKEAAVESALNIMGDVTVGDIASLVGINIEEESYFASYKEMTVREAYELTSAEIATILAVYNEGGFEAVGTYFMNYAMVKLSAYLEDHGEDEIIPGVTVNELVYAVMGDEEMQAKVIAAAEEFAIAYLQANVEALKAEMGDLYEVYKDMPVYGEYTLDQLLEAFETSAPADIIAAIEEEYFKLMTEEGYVLEVLSPWTVVVSQYVTDFEIAEGLTVGDIIAAISDFDGEDSEETFNEMLDFAEGLIYAYLGNEIDLAATYEAYYPLIMDLVVYYDLDEEEPVAYTLDEVISAAIELDSVAAIIDAAVELFDDPAVIEGVEKAAFEFVEQMVDVLMEVDVIEGVAVSDLYAALCDFDDEESKEVFRTLIEYADEVLAEKGIETTVEELFETFYPMISDVVVYEGKTVDEIIDELVELDNMGAVIGYIVEEAKEVFAGDDSVFEMESYKEFAQQMLSELIVYFLNNKDQIMEIADAYALEYLGVTVTDMLGYYAEISGVALYNEYTLNDFVAMVIGGTFDEFIGEEIAKISEDSNYAWEAFTPAIELALTAIEPYSEAIVLQIFDVEYTVGNFIEDAHTILEGSLPINALQAFAGLASRSVRDYVELADVAKYLPAIENEDFNIFMNAVLELSVAQVIDGETLKSYVVDYMKEIKVGEVLPLAMELATYYGIYSEYDIYDIAE